MKRVLFIFLTIILASALFLASCGEAEPAAPQEIRIGTSAPLTGMFAGFGEGNLFGMQAAVDDINAQGGIYVKEYDKKLPVKLMTANSESDPIKSGTLAEDLIMSSKVHLLVSPDMPCSMHNSISTVADRYKIPHVIGGGPVEPWMGARQEAEGNWPYTWLAGFGIATPPSAGDFREGKPGYTIKNSWFQELDEYADQTDKVAGVFATDEPDGRGWYSLFPKLLEEYGLEVIGADKNLGLVPLGTTDFSSVVQEWKDNNVEILWGNAPGPDFGTMWKQARAMDFQPKIVSIGRAPLFYVDVSSWGGNCYAPMQILFDAVERAGTLDGAAINQAIAETDLMTINYRVVFDTDMHFSWIPLFLGQWQKTNQPHVWECPIVFSKHDFLPPSAQFIFPMPYD